MDLNPLNQIDPVVIGGVAAIFWVTYLVLRAYVFKPYIAVMESRDARLEEAEAARRTAEKLAEEAEAESGRVMARARETADRVLQEAHEEAERYRRERLQVAGDEIGHFLEDGRASIATARQNELMALRDQALECVGLACEKLVGETNDDVIETAVDKLIARRVH